MKIKSAEDIKVVYKHLGKHQALGMAFKEDAEMHIDKRLKGLQFLDTFTHEAFHLLFPDITEEEIDRRATIFAELIWKENWRKVDN